PQLPFESVADARWTTPLAAFNPAAGSLPFESVSGTDSVVYHGPPESATVWPLGAVTSRTNVTVSAVRFPAPSKTLTFRKGGAAAFAVVHVYVFDVYGDAL